MSPIWKYLIAAAGLALVVFLIYNKGVRDTKVRIENKTWHEVSRRINESKKVVEKGREFQERVRKSRDTVPNDDLRDSCLLSSDHPYEECRSGMPD